MNVGNVTIEDEGRIYRITFTSRRDFSGETKLELLCSPDVLRVLRRACDEELRKLAPAKPKLSKKSCAHCHGTKYKFIFNEPCEYCHGTGYEPSYLTENEDES
jgi:hypothetical protein